MYYWYLPDVVASPRTPSTTSGRPRLAHKLTSGEYGWSWRLGRIGPSTDQVNYARANELIRVFGSVLVWMQHKLNYTCFEMAEEMIQLPNVHALVLLLLINRMMHSQDCGGPSRWHILPFEQTSGAVICLECLHHQSMKYKLRFHEALTSCFREQKTSKNRIEKSTRTKKYQHELTLFSFDVKCVSRYIWYIYIGPGRLYASWNASLNECSQTSALFAWSHHFIRCMICLARGITHK